MSEARAAGPADAAELVRLRVIMLGSMGGAEPVDDGWQAEARRILRARLTAADGTFAAMVVDQPGRPGALAACAGCTPG